MVEENSKLEAKLWAAADKLRNNMDASEYKHVILGLIFLKFISDSFENIYERIKTEEYADPEDKDEYLAHHVFFVPKDARWSNIVEKAKTPEIGEVIDNAMISIEKDNKTLRNVLPRNYGRPELNKVVLGEVVDLIHSIDSGKSYEESKDILGRIYEYFIGKFASAEGKGGGEFYTPDSVVQLLVEILEPYEGKIYDPACGSGGMFVMSEKFVEAHGGRVGDLSIYGQESNPTTWKLCKMNLAIRGLDHDLGERADDSFHFNQHSSLKADFIIANPPFNISDWGANRLQEDPRWVYGMPPNGNANYAWVQHFIYHLSQKGKAGFVLSNGSMSSNTAGEGEIRKKIIKDDLVECIVALPDKLFYNTGIPACLWFLNRDKKRTNEILFVDCRDMGEMINRRLRELSSDEISYISQTVHSWQNSQDYEDIKGFCKSVSIDEVSKQDFVLTPGRYVGVKDEEEDSEPYEDKMRRLVNELSEQFKKSDELEEEIKKNLEGLGFKI
ncbi:MAG: type I restriction-modification system subunit M [Candidatus Nanoarchaeia archaeon]